MRRLREHHLKKRWQVLSKKLSFSVFLTLRSFGKIKLLAQT